MWANQTVRATTSGYLQPNGTNIVSNLNPYAKEFYPSYMKSWRLKGKSDSKIKEPQLKPCTIIEGPQEGKFRVYSNTKELIDVKYKSTTHLRVYETGILDTKIQVKSQSITSKTAIPDLQKNIPTTVNNLERIKKTSNSDCAAKPNCLATSVKYGTVPQRNPNISKLSSGIQPAAGPASKISTSLTTKTKFVTKLVNPKLVLNGNTKEMPSKSPNKDCLSIKSGTSSNKSSSSIIVNSSSNKIDPKTNKPNIIRPSSQNYVSSKTLEKSVAGSKLKQVSIKSPRKTVASTLRKTETQKVS